MAESLEAKISFVSTTASRLPDLAIKNGQLIFIKDTQKIALDLNDKRIFYNLINVLQTDEERTSLLAPVTGAFYFVIDTTVLWIYQEEWIQLTAPPASMDKIESITEEEIISLFEES